MKAAMKAAVLSDVHANVWALRAVFNFLHELPSSPDEIWFLGDIFGIGPLPYTTFKELENMLPKYWLVGNHDMAVAGHNAFLSTNERAKISDEIHKNILPARTKQEIAEKPRQIFLSKQRIYLSHALPEPGSTETGSLVHYDYNFSPAKNPEGPESLLGRRDLINPDIQIFVVGHSHMQTGWVWNGSNWQMLIDSFGEDLDGNPGNLTNTSLNMSASISFKDLDSRALLLLNPGSVGFPRDNARAEGKPLARFMILDFLNSELKVEYCSVPYTDKMLLDEWNTQGYPNDMSDYLK